MRSIFNAAYFGQHAGHGIGPSVRGTLGVAYLQAYMEAEGTADGALPPLTPPLRDMQQLILEHYDQPLTLDDLAKAASVTPSHLVRLCRKQLATTPMRLLWGTRTDMGIDLLKQTGLNISEIAYRVGFANAFHFSRAVKAKTGLPPRDVRRDAWKPE